MTMFDYNCKEKNCFTREKIMNENMTKIAIVGMGPRGTLLLERLITYLITSNKTENVELLLFDKNDTFGFGCHNRSVSDYLLVNTVAGQITMFFGKGMKDFGPIHEGPSLYEWHKENKNNNTKESDYLTRRDLGEYLNFFYLKQIARMKEYKIEYREIIDEVIDCREFSNKIEILTKDNKFIVSKCTLSMGHLEKSIDKGVIFDQILNTKFIKDIVKNKKIALQGMGLTAFDILSECTEGLNGKFVRDGGKLKYISSGEEPKIFIYSKTGIPLSGKAYNSHSEFVYIPIYFNERAINKLKKEHGRLDFEKHILPLIKCEIMYAYEMKSGRNDLDIDEFFKYERYTYSSTEEYKMKFMKHIENDIEQCSLGKFSSPIKFCQDIIRDLRNIVRYAINEKGLTDASYKEFIQKWHPIFTKICVGPPHIRLEQLQALINSGICSIEFGKSPVIIKNKDTITIKSGFTNEDTTIEVDYLIKGTIPDINYYNSNDTLIYNISRNYQLFSRNDFYNGGLEKQ